MHRLLSRPADSRHWLTAGTIALCSWIRHALPAGNHHSLGFCPLFSVCNLMAVLRALRNHDWHSLSILWSAQASLGNAPSFVISVQSLSRTYLVVSAVVRKPRLSMAAENIIKQLPTFSIRTTWMTHQRKKNKRILKSSGEHCDNSFLTCPLEILRLRCAVYLYVALF